MPSLESSNSPSKARQSRGISRSGVTDLLVWLFRIMLGGVFVVSGISKLIDLWGTVFKIEDYIEVWAIDVPRTVVMMCGLALATFEFTAGLLLATGCYRRVVTWGIATCMLFMLPLTAYIWIANPVSDCGCFGDFIVISNAATFWKNVALMAMTVYLVVRNRRAISLFKAPIQWIVVTISVFYCITVALIGYNIQPMIDFRPYKVGSPIVPDIESSDDSDVRMVYVKDGEERDFGLDELPDETDGWQFVNRIESHSKSDDEQLVVYDPITGYDVTLDYIADVDSLLILVIPEPARADLSYTYSINELADAVTSRGGSVVALLDAGERGIDRWRDHSMASYPCLSADDTQLKQLARGVMSMVWVTNDTIRWKRTVASISLDDVDAVVAGSRSMTSLDFNGSRYMIRLSLTLCLVLVIIYIFQTAFIKILRLGRNKHTQDIAQVENVH